MFKKWLLPSVVATIIAVVALDCSKNDSPVQPQPLGPQLTAVPSSVLLGAGTSQNVLISGGKPPYSISQGPSSMASATFLNPDSVIATLRITGVSVASVSTSVLIRDSLAAKTVLIPISVH